MAKSEHSSKTHPPIPNKPGGRSNWVEQEGHLPPYMDRVAKHIMADSGYPTSRAIAAAVSQTKKRAAEGNPEAIAAVAQWMKMRASAKSRPNKGSVKTARPDGCVIDLAGTRDRGIYQKHKQSTLQKGKKKGDLSRPADWSHGYQPKTEVAGALKAKHISKADLTSSGKPKPGMEKQVDLPTPPHLQKSRTDASRSSKERAREPEDVTHAEAKRTAPKKAGEGLASSVASLRRERARLEAKVTAGTASAAEKKRLNVVVNSINRRARPAKPNPSRG